MGIGLGGPRHRGRHRIRQVGRSQPPDPVRGIFPLINLARQRVRPALGLRVGPAAAHAAHELLGDARVPHVVQVEAAAVEQHVDAVAPALHVLRVQRLVDVADEVDDELGGDGALPGREGAVGVEQARGVVVQGADDAAAVFFAVALEVDAAVLGRRVLGVDEVEVGGEAAPFGVADRVGPGGDAGEVVGCVVAQERLEVGCGGGRDEVAGEVADRDVSEACGRVCVVRVFLFLVQVV